jgi:hypothetical protein
MGSKERVAGIYDKPNDWLHYSMWLSIMHKYGLLIGYTHQDLHLNELILPNMMNRLPEKIEYCGGIDIPHNINNR